MPPATNPLLSRVLPLVGLALALVVAWVLRDVLLAAFAGVLVALALHAASSALHRRWGVPPRAALALVVIGILVGLVVGVGVAGGAIGEQLDTLRQSLPLALAALVQWLESHAAGQWLLQFWRGTELGSEQVSRLASLAGVTVNAGFQALGALVLVVALGVYFAANPSLYVRGFLRLLPQRHRSRAADTLQVSGHQLSGWLLGQGVTMVAVGALTTAGLWLIGMPLALLLGIIAGVLEFVPYFGTLASSVLIVLLAFTEGEETALYAAAVCAVVQFAEAYVIMPLAQRWAVSMPPVLGLLAVVGFGVLFGLPGVLVAVPLMVLVMALVDVLWLQRSPPARAATPDAAGPAIPVEAE